MVRLQVIFLITMFAACGSQVGFDELELSTSKAEQTQWDATPIVLNASYEDSRVPDEPALFSLMLHDRDSISIWLESLDGQSLAWAELYREETYPEQPLDIYDDYDDTTAGRYQIMHPWNTPFRKKYYVKVLTSGADAMARFRLKVKCEKGPCTKDPTGDKLTDRFEPNNTREFAKQSLGVESNLLNLDSSSDVDWVKIPVYLYQSPYINVSVMGIYGLPLDGLQVSAWFECTGGPNNSKCNMYPSEQSHFSLVYPELGLVPGCRGDYMVSIKRSCSDDYSNHGQLFVRVSWDRNSILKSAYYKIFIN